MNPACALVLSGDTLYGTASNEERKWSDSGRGTVFAVKTNNMDICPYGTEFTVLHYFDVNHYGDGQGPYAGLILSSNTLYGTTAAGGSTNGGTLFKLSTDGTGFTNLHNFTYGSDGGFLLSRLVLSGTALYGTAFWGGDAGNGTVFTVNTDGSGFKVLHSFTATPYSTNSDGANPRAGLVLLGNTLYGVAQSGGSSGNGTVFSLFIQPELTIVPSGPYVILTWPTNYAGFTLQSTTNLFSPVWTTNLPPPAVVNGQNTVTNPISSTKQFFRLSQ